MAIVSPSILSADFGKLGADCRMVLDAGAQMLHYDVMDGHFVPNISFGVPVLKSLHKALPDAFYDVHLMISHPLQYAEPFIKAGATLYNFHLECEDDIQATIDAVRALGCKVGLTIPGRGAGPVAGAAGSGAGDERGARLRRAEVHALGAG
jgi:ribulose-phosphate 3-epimerase